MAERGITELLRSAADRSRTDLKRRLFLSRLAFAATAPGALRWSGLLPAGLLPAALAQQAQGELLGKADGLTILNDRPLNAETPAHLLDDPITPVSRFFVRNNGLLPESTDAAGWRLRVSGEACDRPRTYSIEDLKRKFPQQRRALQLECGGNGRSEFRPRVAGNQWSTGAVGCARWTGVRLKDVLKDCGVTEAAVYVGYRGADRHLSGDPNKVVISRGVPVAKALEDESLIAWAMNDEPIPALHGGPLRLVCGGWPGSVSGKWLTQLLLRDRVHDGAKMLGTSYRVPCRPVAPGEPVAEEDLCIIESMPVKSLITFPRSGVEVPVGALSLRGHAWAGDQRVSRVEVSTNFGTTWQAAQLAPPVNRLAWQQWQARVLLPAAGYYEIWARATDDRGRSQPMLVPGWNPKGYLNNACHRVAVRAAVA